MEKVINAVAARRRLGQLLEEAFYRGDVFIIERAGRPMAAVIPIEPVAAAAGGILRYD